MNITRILLIALLLGALSVTCSAAVVVQNDALNANDPRLDQKVTYSADGLRLIDILAELNRSTGVVMTAGVDENDWMVRDRKVIAHVTDMKLGDLMREFSAVLRFHWSRGGEEGKWTYRLWQDKVEHDEEASLRAASEDSRTRESREKRENALADMLNLASLSEKDAGNLKSSDPWRYVLATEPLGGDVARFINGFPEARNAFVQNTEAAFPVSGLSPDLQETVRRIADSYDSLTRSIGVSEDHGDLLTRFNKLQINFNRGASGSGADLISRSLLGSISIGSGSDWLYIPLFDPSSAMGKALGKAIVELRAGKSKEEVGKDLQAEMESAAKKGQASARDISSDPALRRKITLFDKATIAPLPVTLKSLAEKEKMNVISDYFPGAPPTIPGGEKTLGEQLQTIRSAYGSNWTKAGSSLRFTDVEWFKKRAWEVPRVWIDYWLARGKENDGLMLDELTQIAKLRDDQIDHTVLTDAKLVGYGAGEAARNRHILRFYGSLTDDQRRSLVTQSLAVGSVSDDQWEALKKALASKGAAYAAAAKGVQYIRLTWSGTDVVEYKFDYFPGGDDPAVLFKLTCGVVYKPAE